MADYNSINENLRERERERERGLQLWKNDNAICPFCGERQSLLHNYTQQLQSC